MPQGNPQAGELWFRRIGTTVAVVLVEDRQSTSVDRQGLDFVRFERLSDRRENAMNVDLFVTQYRIVDIPRASVWAWPEGDSLFRHVDEPPQAPNWTVTSTDLAGDEQDDLFVETFLARYRPTGVVSEVLEAAEHERIDEAWRRMLSPVPRTAPAQRPPLQIDMGTLQRIQTLVRTFADLRSMVGATVADEQLQALLQSLPEDESALFMTLWQSEDRPPGPEEEYPRAEALPPDPNVGLPRGHHVSIGGFTRRPLRGFTHDQLLERAQVMAAEDEAVFAALDAAAVPDCPPGQPKEEPAPSVWERLMDED